jgi:hypothetical protein
MAGENVQSQTRGHVGKSTVAAFLHNAASVSALVGGIGAVALMLWVGRRQESGILLAVFVVWALLPFLGLLLVNWISKSWPARGRVIMDLITLGIVDLGDGLWTSVGPTNVYVVDQVSSYVREQKIQVETPEQAIEVVKLIESIQSAPSYVGMLRLNTRDTHSSMTVS